MRCPSCGTENPDDARFCSSCGTTLGAAREEEAPPTPAVPGPDRRSWASGIGSALRGGWRVAVPWAVIAFAAVFVLSLLLSLLNVSAQPFQFAALAPGFEPPDLSALDVLGGALIGTYTFHHVTVAVDLPAIDIPDAPFPGGFDFSFSFSAAPMLAMALVATLLALGGRAVARAASGSAWARAAQGAKIALPYVVLAFAVSFAARQSIELPQIPGAPFASGAVTVGVSPWSAFAWPLVLGLVFGLVGGIWAVREEAFGSAAWDRVRAAIGGAWRMTWVALALSFVGLLVLAAVYPDGTRAYFEIVGRLGASGGTYFVLTTILFLPNMATWVTAGAVGGSAASLSFFGSSCALVSYLRFPSGVVEGAADPAAFDVCALVESGVRFEAAPIGYFLFLLVPIAATVLGGRRAARGAADRSERILRGAAAGGVFAVFLLGLMLVSGTAGEMSGPFVALFGGGSVGLGPGILSGFGLALVWGVVGGILGALSGGRRAEPASRPEEPAEP